MKLQRENVVRRLGVALACAGALVAPLALATPAHAQPRFSVHVGPPVFVAPPPPRFYGAPPVYVAPPPPRFWGGGPRWHRPYGYPGYGYGRPRYWAPPPPRAYYGPGYGYVPPPVYYPY